VWERGGSLPHGIRCRLVEFVSRLLGANRFSWPPNPDILRIHRLGQQTGGKKRIGDFLLFT
jgi:hypothetical protein